MNNQKVLLTDQFIVENKNKNDKDLSTHYRNIQMLLLNKQTKTYLSRIESLNVVIIN